MDSLRRARTAPAGLASKVRMYAIAEPDADRVTELLRKYRSGDQCAFQRLIPLVYADLRALAGASLRKERKGHTLSATGLAHEAYLRLAGHAGRDYQDRPHFLTVASHVMRQILVDYACKRKAAKRGGGQAVVSLAQTEAPAAVRSAALIDIDEALRALESQDSLKAELLEMRFFGGFTAEESAERLGMPVTTVRRELRVAQAWLWRELGSIRGRRSGT